MPTKKQLAGIKGEVTKKVTEIAKLEAALEAKPTLKERLLSRKFLLSAIPLFITLVGAVIVFFGYELTAEQNASLSVISTTIVSLVGLFTLPEALTDYKERMVRAGQTDQKKIDVEK